MLRIVILATLFFTVSLFASVGQIVSLKGDAIITRSDTQLNAKLGEKLLEKDIIKTTNNGRLQILFNDETVITLGRDSTFSVDEYIFDEKKHSNSKTQFQFLTGKFKVISGGISKINRKGFKLKTKSASIGIRGTQIHMDLTQDQEVILCTAGEIEVTLSGTGASQVLKAGEKVSIKIQRKKTSNKPSSKKPSSKKSSSSSSSSDSSSDDSSSSSSSEDDTSTTVTSETENDTKYDTWTQESTTITKAVEDAFDKGHTQSYSLTSLDGEINEKQSGGGYQVKSFDTTTASFSQNMTIDFGKGKNDTSAVQLGTLTIHTNNYVKNMHGKINDNNEIELTYDTDFGTDYAVTVNTDLTNPTSDQGKMTFKNTDLDVEGQDLGMKTRTDLEDVRIKDIQFEAQ